MGLTPMKKVHIPAVARLCAQLGYEATEAELGERWDVISRSNGDRLLVALGEGGEVLGWGHAKAETSFLTGRRLEIAALVVDEKVRGRGVGGELMAAFERWGEEQGCVAVRVASRSTRERAHAFYLGRGYVLDKISHLFKKKI